jgi:hypothetical protein
VEKLEDLQIFFDIYLDENPKKKSQLVRKVLPKFVSYVTTIISGYSAYGDSAGQAFIKGWELGSNKSRSLFWVHFKWRSNCRCFVFFTGDPIEEAKKKYPEIVDEWKERIVQATMAA